MRVKLRPARSTDAGTAGAILSEFIARTSWIPKLYNGAETISFCGVMIDRGWMTVAEGSGGVVGFLARDKEEVAALYLAGSAQRQGVGRALIQHAQSASNRLTLRTFQKNRDAIRFYRSHGFCEIGRSDGAVNEEQLPDVQFVWTKGERA